MNSERWQRLQAMTRLTLEMPESALAGLHQAPGEFAQEMRDAD